MDQQQKDDSIDEDQIEIKETELLIMKDKEYQIDLQLIMKTSIDQNFIDIMTEEQKTNELMHLKTVHLEFFNIKKIENLELFDKLQVLFLQHNKIVEMENLETLINLEYLSLKNNQIQVLKGLKNSKKLAFLDVQENQISQVIFEQVPQFIEILNISNNPIETNTTIRKKLLSHLKIIDEIDSVKIDQNERFLALGIFPSELEQYQKKLTQRKMKKLVKFQKLDKVLDVDTVEIQGDDLNKDDDNLTETTIQGIHDLTETLITKAQTSKLERLFEAQQELLEYQKLHQEIQQEILQYPEEVFIIQYKLKNIEKSGAYKFSAQDIANIFEKNFEGQIYNDNFQLLKIEINEQVDAAITSVYEDKDSLYNKFSHSQFLREILEVEELKPEEEEEEEEIFSKNCTNVSNFVVDEKLKILHDVLDISLSFQDALDQVDSLELINKFYKAFNFQQQKDSKVQIKLLVQCRGKYAAELHQQKLFFHNQDKDPAFIDLMSSKPFKNKDLELQLKSQIFKVKRFTFGMIQCNQKKEFTFQQFHSSTKLDNLEISKQYFLKDDPKYEKFISLMIILANQLIIKVVIDLSQCSVIYTSGNEYYCKLLSPPQFFADIPGKQRFEKNNIKSQFKQIDNIFLNYLLKTEKINEIQRLIFLNNTTIYFELEERSEFLKYRFENFCLTQKISDKITHIDLKKDLTFNRLLNNKYLSFSIKFNILSIISQNKMNMIECILQLVKFCENEAKKLSESNPKNLDGIFELAFSQFCKIIPNLCLSPDFEIEKRNILYVQQFTKCLERAKVDYIEIIDPKKRLAFIRRVSLTPSGLLYFNKQPEVTSGILRQLYLKIEYFLRVHFENENQDNISNIPYITQCYYQDFVYPNLNILNNKYQLFTWSGSSLRSATCWFLSFEQAKTDRMQIIQSIGNFTNLKPDEIAKNAARLGQNLSSSFTIQLNGPFDIKIADDLVDKNKKLYTDGIGKISFELIEQIRKQHQFRNYDSISAIQIRYEGAKGLLVLDETLKGKIIVLRKSMIKYNPAKNGYSSKLQILDFNKYRAGYLNRQIIMLLITLKVNYDVFIQLQNEYLKKIESLQMKDSSIYKYFTIEYCDELLGAPNVIEALQCYINIGMDKNILCSGVLQKLKQRGLLQLRKKTAILVEKAARVLGVVDEHSILQPNEVYCLIYDEILKKVTDNNDKEFQNIVGEVLVTRNPCLHPGDIRKVVAVSTNEILKRNNGKNPFSQFINCLVFPAKGDSLPCQIAGGDLDGDLYFICWDERLLPAQVAKPMVYDDVKQNQIKKINFRENNNDLHNNIDRTFEIKNMIDFLFTFLNSETLGKIDNSHLSWADQSKLLANDPNCLELAELHSEAVDFVKNGKQVYVDPKLICKIFPDYMEKDPGSTFQSSTVIGKLYRDILSMGDKYDTFCFGYQQNDLPQIETTLLYKFKELFSECKKIQPEINIQQIQQKDQQNKEQVKDNQQQEQSQENQESQLNEEIIQIITQYIKQNYSNIMKISISLIKIIFEQFHGIMITFNVKNEFEIYSGNFSNLLKGDGLHHKKKLNVEKNQKRIIALIVQLQQELEKKLSLLKEIEILQTISLMNFILSYSPTSHKYSDNTFLGQLIKQLIDQLATIENWKILTQSFTVWYRGAAQYFFWKELRQIYDAHEVDFI